MRWISILAILLVFESFGQSIQGTVLDENEVPLPYAHVINLSKNTGTVTQENGYFLIPAAIGDTIRLTFTGYKPLIIVANEDQMAREIASTMAPDNVVLQSVWVFSDPKYKVPKRHQGVAIKIPGIPEPSTEPTKDIQFTAGLSPMLAPNVAVRGLLSYFSKDNVEKRKAEEAYVKTAQVITFSKLMALEKTRSRLCHTFKITDSELDRLITMMNMERPHIQKLNREKAILSQVTAYISEKTR